MPTGIAPASSCHYVAQFAEVFRELRLSADRYPFASATNPAVESKRRFGYNARPVYPVTVG